MRRLKVDVIDLYQAHWPADDIDETLEGWTELARLQQEGKVRWIGASNFSREELEKAGQIAPVTSLQPPYSLIKRDIEAEVLPYCQEQRIGVIVYSPMASGLLTGAMSRERAATLPENDWRSRSPEFTEPKLSANLALVDRLRRAGASHGRSPGEMAVAWTLHHPAVTGAIVGARNAAQVDGIVGGAEVTLSAEDITVIGV